MNAQPAATAKASPGWSRDREVALTATSFVVDRAMIPAASIEMAPAMATCSGLCPRRNATLR